MDKATLKFLAELKKNNDKEWFAANKGRYETAMADFTVLVTELIAGCDIRGSLKGLKAKDAIFRIYRDVRFAKDKSPYKPNFGAVIAPGGRKSEQAAFYIHIEPGNRSRCGGGIYMPEPAALQKIRTCISEQGKKYAALTSGAVFSRTYPERYAEERLKKVPAGFSADDPMAETLKLKHFVFLSPLKDTDVTSEKFPGEILKRWKILQPVNDFFNRALK